ncbi:MAG: MBL fold metallo-hydrolase [Balneola sp.]
MKLVSVCLLVLSMILTAPKSIDSEAKTSFIKQKINERLYILKASNYNTNIGIFVSNDEIVLVDPMSGFNNHENLLDEIRTISNKPIKYVINTHNHLDHSGANEFFKDLGATIISQSNSEYTSALHQRTFDNSFSLELGDETVELFHISAHTFNDALVYFKESNVIFMGDTYMTNSYPHFYYGGGSTGLIEIIAKTLSLGDEQTLVIPAHGKLTSTKAELETYKSNSEKWIHRISELHREGLSTDQMIHDKELERLSTLFNGTQVNSARFKQTIEKTIAVDLIESVPITSNILSTYAGSYTFQDGMKDEIVLMNEHLFMRRKGAFMYKLIPLSLTRFQLAGQVPNRFIQFHKDNSDNVKGLTYYNGKPELEAVAD